MWKSSRLKTWSDNYGHMIEYTINAFCNVHYKFETPEEYAFVRHGNTMVRCLDRLHLY